MSYSPLGWSFRPELDGKKFCVAGLVRLGRELTDSCVWVLGVCVLGVGRGRGMGEDKVGSAEGDRRGKRSVLQKLIPTELLPRAPCFRVFPLFHTLTHSFVFPHSANIC